MSYSTLALMAKDADFQDRITACVATQGIRDAERWATDNRWAIAGQPGFDEAYSYALNIGTIAAPGRDVSVISDTQLLSAVQLLLGR